MNRTAEYDLVGIGRAFIDVVASVDDRFIKSHNLPKGQGIDVSVPYLIRIRSELERFTLEPGGSASNTVAGVAALGGKTAFLGKLCDDAAGRSFRNAFRQSNVIFPSADYPTEDGAISATCLALMTSDGSVTIVNNRGVADKLTRNDINQDIIANSCTLLVAGEMLLSADSKDATQFAIDVALHANRKVALSLNNLFFKEKNDFLSRADFVLGNRNEFKHNFPNRDIETFTNADLMYVMTDGGNGAHIAGRGQYIKVPVQELVPNAQVAVPSYVGAGDQFAAGFLFGFAKGLPYRECGQLGAEAAAAVMRASGARPNGDWTGIAKKYYGPGSGMRPSP